MDDEVEEVEKGFGGAVDAVMGTLSGSASGFKGGVSSSNESLLLKVTISTNRGSSLGCVRRFGIIMHVSVISHNFASSFSFSFSLLCLYS